MGRTAWNAHRRVRSIFTWISLHKSVSGKILENRGFNVRGDEAPTQAGTPKARPHGKTVSGRNPDRIPKGRENRETEIYNSATYGTKS